MWLKIGTVSKKILLNLKYEKFQRIFGLELYYSRVNYNFKDMLTTFIYLDLHISYFTFIFCFLG